MVYVERIELHIDTDFSISLENSKSLLEGISKQICKDKQIALSGGENFHALIKTAFDAIGYEKGGFVNVVGGALSAIGQQLGKLRKEVGTTSHGGTSEQIERRNLVIDEISRDFLIDATDLVASFMIRNHENEILRREEQSLFDTLDYYEAEEFNASWDDSYGEFSMGDYSYPASEILFNVDKQAYVTEYNTFNESPE